MRSCPAWVFPTRAGCVANVINAVSRRWYYMNRQFASSILLWSLIVAHAFFIHVNANGTARIGYVYFNSLLNVGPSSTTWSIACWPRNWAVTASFLLILNRVYEQWFALIRQIFSTTSHWTVKIAQTKNDFSLIWPMIFCNRLLLWHVVIIL